MLQDNPLPYLQVEVVGPVPDDFVLRSGVPDLVLVDVVTSWCISILIEGHWSPSNAYRRGTAQHPELPAAQSAMNDGIQGFGVSPQHGILAASSQDSASLGSRWKKRLGKKKEWKKKGKERREKGEEKKRKRGKRERSGDEKEEGRGRKQERKPFLSLSWYKDHLGSHSSAQQSHQELEFIGGAM